MRVWLGTSPPFAGRFHTVSWVVLTGYMGAGKSTVGRAVAEHLDRPFLDSDAVIEHAAALDIPRIFATKGEVWFRRTEERTIRGIVESSPGGVLAIGGGAIENPKTRDLLHRVASVIWLHAEPEQLWERVNGSSRPLATDEAQFLRRYARRERFYRETAHVEIDALLPFENVVTAAVNFASGGSDPGRVE